MIDKALELNERIGRRKGVARVFNLRGVLQQARGDSQQAEQSLLRSIEVAREVGDRVCMANAYQALGVIFKSRGESSAATILWRDARQIFDKVGITQRVCELDNLLTPPNKVAEAS